MLFFSACNEVSIRPVGITNKIKLVKLLSYFCYVRKRKLEPNFSISFGILDPKTWLGFATLLLTFTALFFMATEGIRDPLCKNIQFFLAGHF